MDFGHARRFARLRRLCGECDLGGRRAMPRFLGRTNMEYHAAAQRPADQRQFAASAAQWRTKRVRRCAEDCTPTRRSADLTGMSVLSGTTRRAEQPSGSGVLSGAMPTHETVYASPTMAPADGDQYDVAGVRCHLIGIGGCGMSGLARMLRARGGLISGSDVAPSAVLDGLRRDHVGQVSLEQNTDSLPDDTEFVVGSAAIGRDHPEMLAAVERGLPVLSYAEALGRCMLGRTSVAIAGTHGKSTTSAMLGVALAGAGLDPTVIVGAACGQVSGELGAAGDAADIDAGVGEVGVAACNPDQFGVAGASRPVSGFRLGAERVPLGALAGRPGLLVAEACEYNRSFHHLRPTIAAITSVEADHLDVYGSLDAIVEAFNGFAALLPDGEAGGRLLIAHERAHRREVTAGVRCPVETIGWAPGADYVVRTEPAVNGETTSGGRQRVTVTNAAGEVVARFRLRQPGEHMAMNAATAAVLALWCGGERETIEVALSGFAGVERRLQPLGAVPTADAGEAVLWDDYGHHPTEIDATLRALRRFEPTLAAGKGEGASESPQEGSGRLICVFQPHQHSRTRFLLEEFAQSFAEADVVIVPHIYFVRDSAAEKTKVSAADLVDRLRDRGVAAMHLYPCEAIADQLRAVCRDGDVVVTMGAGPVWQVGRLFASTSAAGRGGGSGGGMGAGPRGGPGDGDGNGGRRWERGRGRASRVV